MPKGSAFKGGCCWSENPKDVEFQKPDASREDQELPGVGEGGSSGHSNLRRFRFAFAAYGPFTCLLVLFFAKDTYVLKFGANAERVGIVATAWSALFPLFYPIAGQLMDWEPQLLAIPGWGRRAPWFLSHLVPMAMVAAMIYLPGLAWTPEAGSWVLEAWLGTCLGIGGWCIAVLLNSFESARAEIYPFCEERALVEAMAKFVGCLAVVSGGAPQLILWTVFTPTVRFTASVLLFLCVLLSLEGVPVLRDAQQPRNPKNKRSLRECFSVLLRAPMFHASALRFWYTAADTTSLNFAIYYLTFTNGLVSSERTKWMFIQSVLLGFLELGLLTPLWGLAWSGEAIGRAATAVQRFIPRMRTTCLAFHIMGAFVPPLVLRVMPMIFPGARPWEWVLAFCLQRVFFSPQTFFRTNSFCWAVDEDCHMNNGNRREAIHAGTIKLFEDEGRTLATLLFVGLGAAGLQTRNCELVCNGRTDRAVCVDACEAEDILRQPPVVSTYVEVVLTFVVPAFSLLCALHIWLYPVHGPRLERLTSTQAVVFKSVSAEKKSPVAVVATIEAPAPLPSTVA